MRKTALVAIAAALIGAAIGIWATLVATNPGTASAGKPSTAAISPFEIMEKHGRDLPPGQSVDPF
jgi:hypothetical protein